MAVYMIGYDLKRPGRNYPELFRAIENLAASRWHCLDSTWLIETGRSAENIRDTLVPHIDANDRLLVDRVYGTWASWHLPENCVDWLNNAEW